MRSMHDSKRMPRTLQCMALYQVQQAMPPGRMMSYSLPSAWGILKAETTIVTRHNGHAKDQATKSAVHCCVRCSLLEEEARELLGSMMLVTLIESATSWLTDNNSPEGTCAFCLEPVTSSSGAAAEEPLTRLPCFHAFHT